MTQSQRILLSESKAQLADIHGREDDRVWHQAHADNLRRDMFPNWDGRDFGEAIK